MGHRIVSASMVVVGVVLALAALTAGVVGLGLRYRWPVVVDGLRRVSRSTINPRQMESAGQPGAYASVIEHTGRVSGQPYRTPVVVLADAEGFTISLTYGTRADWVRNVLATGVATVVTEGETHADLPVSLVPLDEAGDWIPASERRLLRGLGVESCLRLTRPA